MNTNRAKITPQEFIDLMNETIPLSRFFEFSFIELDRGKVSLKMDASDIQLRAGGTLSGPSIMTLVDTALYAAVLSQLGMQAMALTSTLNFHFLRRPKPNPLIAEATLIKVGKRSVTGIVHILSEGNPDPICFASGSYSLPDDLV